MRKEITVTLNDRGNELTFRIKEMPATKVERWIIRLAGALSATGVFSADVADGVDAQKAIADFLLTGGLSLYEPPAPRGFRAAATENISPLISPLIINHYATMAELQTVYDYEDVFMMLECIRVDSYNQWAIQRAAEREAQHGSIC